MSQVLTLRFPKRSTPEASVFLDAWETMGTWSRVDNDAYELSSPSGARLMLSFTEAGIEIAGYPQNDAYAFVKGFGDDHGGELLYEGEWLPRDDTAQRRGGALNPFAKAAGVVGVAVIVLLVIVALPVLLLVGVVRLGRHLLRSSRRGRPIF